MALEFTPVTRVFIHNGRQLPDPDPSMTPDDVRVLYSAVHPDLLNATVEDGAFDGQMQIFEFRRAVGNKG